MIAHHTATAGAADAAGNRSPGTRLPPGCLPVDAHEGIDTADEFAPSPDDAERSDNRYRRQLPMYRLTVVYDEPADKEAFDRRYTDEHVPLVKASPGLVSFQLSHPQGGTPYLVAELFWKSEDAFKAWTETPERAQVHNHAQGCGTTFTTYAGSVAEV